jgi:hypothetical protein
MDPHDVQRVLAVMAETNHQLLITQQRIAESLASLAETSARAEERAEARWQQSQQQMRALLWMQPKHQISFWLVLLLIFIGAFLVQLLVRFFQGQ